NRIAKLVAEMGFRGVLTEGWEPALNNRSAAFVYRAIPGSVSENGEPPAVLARPIYLLLRNHRLSDAISYRFADARSQDFPLSEEKFSTLVSQIGGRLCNLFMDFET